MFFCRQPIIIYWLFTWGRYYWFDDYVAIILVHTNGNFSEPK